MNPIRMKAKIKQDELKGEQKKLETNVSRIFFELQGYIDPYFTDAGKIKANLILAAAQELMETVKTFKENQEVIEQLQEELD